MTSAKLHMVIVFSQPIFICSNSTIETPEICEICSKLIIKALERRHWHQRKDNWECYSYCWNNENWVMNSCNVAAFTSWKVSKYGPEITPYLVTSRSDCSHYFYLLFVFFLKEEFCQIIVVRCSGSSQCLKR